ncbi:hypothetical protein HanPSC8_Chr17g0781791 [Helianthus annuus]|nr:hypothetical protein HanHA89_Chr17g0715821 [Helianthus annuus]KAJ0633240.1 hypothetical protein HanLR1_Chr17g0674341 [Helianthus annuus]KAJ0814123.1 hypothetical protein HanPSC8_Chr17g0781791 [Helianthus annuus]
MSIPSISTFMSKYSNPVTLQLLSHETLCSDSIICLVLKSLCEEVLAETHSVDRARPEEDSRAPTNPMVAEGSASARVPRKNRRRKSKDITTIEPYVDQHVEQSAEEYANPPKRRGPSINHNVTRYLQNMPEGFKITLTLDKATKAFVGTSATDFATELGIIVRDVLPMRFHKWDSVPEDVKTLMYEKLEVGVGPVLRKKDNWMKSSVESSQRDSTENEDLRNQVTELKEELKQSNEKYERVTEFLSRKYPDFESTISTNDASEDDGLNALHNESDNTI